MQAKFIGRWVPSGNNMTTGYPGSSFSFKVSGTHNVTVETSGASRVAYKIDDGSYVKASSGTVTITGLTLSTHTIKVVLTYTSLNNTWAGTNYATVSNITVDQDGEIVAVNPTKRRVLVLGDSITEGFMYVSSEGASKSASELTYWNKLGDMLSTDMIPCGIGGIGYVNSNTYTSFPPLSTNPSYIENINSSLVNTDTNFDIILILLGVNDWKSKTEIDNDYVTTVTGCITRIKTKYPSADIHALIPFNNNGKPSLEQVYNAQGVHIIPQTWYSQITFGDSLHPNSNGHTIIATNLKSYFENYYGSAYFKEASMKRIDTVYIDTNGTVQKATGTMADSPVKPILPSGAIRVADVVVEQGANTGTVVDTRQTISTVNDLKKNLRAILEDEVAEDFIFAPSFQTSPQWFEHLSVSKNGLDFYKIKNYGANTDFEGHAVATDVSTIFYNGYFYQIYDYLAHPHPQWLINEGLFLGGNGIQIRRTKDFKHFEFFDVPLSATWLQTWAPEFFVDGNTVYVFVSLSDCQQKITENSYRGGKVEWVKHTYVMSTTDFVTWTTPTLVDLSAGLDHSSDNITSEIDPFVIKDDNVYYMFVSDQYNGKITQFSSNSLTSGYTKLQIIGSGEPSIYREAPAVIKFNGGYYLYTNSGTTTHVHYTEDITKWYNYRPVSKMDNVSMIHFTPVVISDSTPKSMLLEVMIDALINPFAENITKNVNSSINYLTDKLVLYPNTLNTIAYSNVANLTYNSYLSLLKAGDTCSFINTVESKTLTLQPDSGANVRADFILSKIYGTVNTRATLKAFGSIITSDINNKSMPLVRTGTATIPAFDTANTGKTVTVDLGTNMPNTNYAVMITNTNGGIPISAHKYAVTGRYAANFTLYVYSTAITSETTILWSAIE